MHPAEINRVVFRQLNVATGFRGGSAGRRTIGQQLPRVPLGHVVHLAGQTIHLPNWMLVAGCAAALGVSMTLSAGLTKPQTPSVAPSIVRSQNVVHSQSLVWSGLSAPSESTVQFSFARNGQTAVVESQIQSMNSELQQLQRDNDALRNLTQQQAGDLTTARTDLATSQDTLNGESQDLGSRLQAVQQDLDGRVSDLQASVKSADDTVNEVRKLLGMPAVSK